MTTFLEKKEEIKRETKIKVFAVSDSVQREVGFNVDHLSAFPVTRRN